MKALLVALIISSATTAYADTNTLITEDTYTVLQSSSFSSCTANLNDSNKRVYCACMSGVMTMNVREVVKKHRLRYEEELPAYFAEMFPSSSQVASCKKRSQN